MKRNVRNLVKKVVFFKLAHIFIELSTRRIEHLIVAALEYIHMKVCGIFVIEYV